MVQKRVNIWICYYKRNKCRCTNTPTQGFHDEWQRDISSFCLPVDSYYWKLSGTTPNNGTTGSLSGVGGTQVINLDSQHTSYISELVQRHQG